MRRHRAELLRQAGRLDEAQEAASRGLRSRKTRPEWLSLAAEILQDKGRTEEARTLWREWLAVEQKSLAKASTPSAKYSFGWAVALGHARLGEKDLARAAIAQAPALPESTPTYALLWVEAPALVALQDWQRIAELLRRHSTDKNAFYFYDPCSSPELAPMRAVARYAELFSRCPPAKP